MAQLVEHILGKDEVPSSNLGSSSKKKSRVSGFFFLVFFTIHYYLLLSKNSVHAKLVKSEE